MTRTVEAVAAVLLVLEILILITGVVSRYVFGRPLIWSDELASILFLWLAMFGAVVALDRGEQMRMSALVELLPAKTHQLVDTFTLTLSVVLLGALFMPALHYAQEEIPVTTATLGVSNAWRAAALPVGICLMFVLERDPSGVNRIGIPYRSGS